MRPLFCSPRVGPMVWMNLHLRYLADGVHGRLVVEPMRTWYHQQSWFRASPQSIFLFPPPWMCWKPRARLHTARAHPRQLSCTSPARNPWHFPHWVWAVVSCPTACASSGAVWKTWHGPPQTLLLEQPHQLPCPAQCAQPSGDRCCEPAAVTAAVAAVTGEN